MSDSLATFLTVATGLLALAGWLAMRTRGWRWLSGAASTAGVACALAVGAFVVMKGERPAHLPSITGDLLSPCLRDIADPACNRMTKEQYVANTDVWDAVAERQLIDRKLVTPNKATPPKPPPVTVPTPPGDDGEPIVTAPPPTVAPPVVAPARPAARPAPPAPPPGWTLPRWDPPRPESPGQVATPPTEPSPSLAERLTRQGVTDDQVHRAVDLVELAKRQISQLSVFVAWRDELPWGRQTPIKAVIASADRAEAEASLVDTSGKTRTEETIVAVGRKVRAELSGPNVEISKPEQTVRDVTNLQNVTFEWLVKPTRPGRTTLTLRVFNQVITPDGPIELERPALVHEMSVKIGVLDWLTWHMERMKGLQWLIGGVLAALGFAFANRARLRRWWRRRHPPTPPVAPPPAASPPGSPRP